MYKLDKNLAKSYDQRGFSISEAGKYTGTIEAVVHHEGNSPNGKSENMILKFVSDSKQKANFFINTSYHNGTVNEGGKRPARNCC